MPVARVQHPHTAEVRKGVTVPGMPPYQGGPRPPNPSVARRPGFSKSRCLGDDPVAGRPRLRPSVSCEVILLDAADLRASRPGRPLFADVSLTISSGDRIAIVGLNGAGKTTLLRQLTGITISEGAGGGEARQDRGVGAARASWCSTRRPRCPGARWPMRSLPPPAMPSAATGRVRRSSTASGWAAASATSWRRSRAVRPSASPWRVRSWRSGRRPRRAMTWW